MPLFIYDKFYLIKSGVDPLNNKLHFAAYEDPLHFKHCRGTSALKTTRRAV